ncbi:hypothetical protein ACOME3_002212 [Neoechinorhynchus agilis]
MSDGHFDWSDAYLSFLANEPLQIEDLEAFKMPSFSVIGFDGSSQMTNARLRDCVYAEGDPKGGIDQSPLSKSNSCVCLVIDEMILKRMPVRYRLAYMISLGFVISFGIRCNMGVAVVAMIENRTVLIANSSNGTSFSSVNVSRSIRVEIERLIEVNVKAPEFHWSPETISVLDSSYFWGYILTQIPGGYLSAKFPAHKVLGFAFGISAFLNALIPLAVKTHVSMAMIVRIFQGLVEGVTYPTCHGIWRYWAPPQERARLTTITFSGSYAGAVLGMPLSGIMTENISWQLSFYIYGILGLLWSYAWFQFSSERPSTSFQIDQDELTYIEESIGTTSSYGDKVWIKPPWIQIVKSLPVWSIIVANFCRSFSFYLLIVGQAFYFKEALGITVGSSGFLAALPHLVMTCVVPLSGYLADYLQTKKDISTTAVRKIMNCGGENVQC